MKKSLIFNSNKISGFTILFKKTDPMYSYNALYSFRILFILLFILLSNAAPVFSGIFDHRRILILGINSDLKNTDSIILGQINTQILAIFSSKQGFSSKALYTYNISKHQTKALARHLNLTRKIKNFNKTIYKFKIDDLRNMASSYAVLAPRVLTYKLKQKKERKKDKKTNKISYIETYILNIAIEVHVIDPLIASVFSIGKFSVKTRDTSKHGVFFKAIKKIGKLMVSVIEDMDFFDISTEINRIEKGNVLFLNKEKYKISPGDEFSFFKTTRYEDGYVDEAFSGLVRISGQSEDLWKGRVIFGNPASVGNNLKPYSRLGMSISLDLMMYLIDLPKDRFSGFTNSFWTPSGTSKLSGFGLDIEFEIGYSFRIIINTAYLFDNLLTIYQGKLGFGWNLLIGRSFSFQISFFGNLRLINNTLGIVNDSSEFDGKTLEASAYNPGTEILTSLNIMLGKSVIFKINAGYSYFLPLDEDDWTFHINGSKDNSYKPGIIKRVMLGGPVLGCSLSFRI